MLDTNMMARTILITVGIGSFFCSDVASSFSDSGAYISRLLKSLLVLPL